MVELDGMADINAQLGVIGSDALIVAVAERLKQALPSGVVCGRVGSDEFALMLTAAGGVDAGNMVRAVLDAIAQPHWIDTVVRISAHAGYAQSPRDAATRGELTRRAELALRAASKKGAGAIVAFEHAIDTVSTDQKFIQRELPRALTANELELHYQPIVRADGGGIVGVEALLRWNHASQGFIPPAVFVRVAEDAGLMDQLGEFVLAPRARRRGALARSLCRGQPVAGAGARPQVRGPGRGHPAGERGVPPRGWCWKSPKAC